MMITIDKQQLLQTENDDVKKCLEEKQINIIL